MLSQVTGVSVVMALAVGCGPKMKRETAEARTYESVRECWQGPLEAHFTGRGAKWGESIVVRACSPAGVGANAKVEVDGVWRMNGPVGSGEANNQRCTVGRRTAAQPGSDDRGGRGSSGAGVGPGAAASATGSDHFAISNDAKNVCFSSMTTELSLGKVQKGARIRVVLWAEVPNDIANGFFQLRHVVHKPNVSDAEWEAHLAKKRKKSVVVNDDGSSITDEELDELIARSKASEEKARKERLARTRPSGPPPTARLEARQSPPFENAEWMPGYWDWQRDWVWVRGRWRAPHKPPASRSDPRPRRPAIGVWIWSPGYWSWNGRSFVWNGGAWIE